MKMHKTDFFVGERATGLIGMGPQFPSPARLLHLFKVLISTGALALGAAEAPGAPNVLPWGVTVDGVPFDINPPPDLTNVIGVAVGQDYFVALRADGTLTAWGWPYDYRTNLPSELGNVVSIAVNGVNNLALRADGTAISWTGLTLVTNEMTGLVAIAAGEFHSLALRADGTVVAWGDNSEGQTNVPPNLANVVAVAAGSDHSLVLRSDGTVAAWGFSEHVLTNIPDGLTNVIRVAAGAYHNLTLRQDGKVVAWGDNSQSQCDVPPELTNVMAIAAGGFQSLAIQADGTLTAWGRHEISWPLPTMIPITVPVGLTNVLAAAGGVSQSLALLGGSPQLFLSNPNWTRNQFSVTLPTQNGRVYTLEYKDSLRDNSWTALPLVAGRSGFQTLSDSGRRKLATAQPKNMISRFSAQAAGGGWSQPVDWYYQFQDHCIRLYLQHQLLKEAAGLIEIGAQDRPFTRWRKGYHGWPRYELG